MKISFTLIGICAACLAATTMAKAQVPKVIHFQGKVTVAGTNFYGDGQFKFALINQPGTVTFWSNDETSTSGSEPADVVKLTVGNGYYSVLLGDTNVPGMTSLSTDIFEQHPEAYLRIWFRAGAVGSFQVLSPDLRMASVGYAMMTASIPQRVVTEDKIALGAITSSTIADGTIGAVDIQNDESILSRASGGAVVALNGSVGIGTQAPNQDYALHVSGNARFDGGITVASEQTLMIPFCAFMPADSVTQAGTDYKGDTDGTLHNASSYPVFYAPVQIADDATITRIDLYAVDDEPSELISINLKRVGILSSGSATSLTTLTTAGATSSIREFTISLNHVVEAKNYVYWIMAVLGSPGQVGARDLRLRAVRISYTKTSLP